MRPARHDQFDDGPDGNAGGDDWRASREHRPRGWRAIFREGDNPLTWALPLGRYFGIEVRLGLLFILFAAGELLRAWSDGTFLPHAQMVASLFVIVLLHEFGHCFACRRVGGLADEILMWPLGGLAACRPPHHWKAEFITTAGGPAVNVVLGIALGGAILLTGGTWHTLVFNPLQYAGVWLDYANAWWKGWLWYLYFTNLILLAFNVLVPAFPMDGGRMLQQLLWRRMGYRRSMGIATSVGLGAAMVLGVVGLITESFTMIGVAIFVGLTCFMERQRLRFTALEEGESGGEGWLPELEGWKSGTPAGPRRAGAGGLRLVGGDDDPDRAAVKKRQEEAARENAEVDRILAKIAASGLSSLTRAEQRFLRQTTTKKRLE